jgi:hypothetical protein
MVRTWRLVGAHLESLLVGVSQRHGVLQGHLCFELDVGLQWVVQAIGEDVDMMLLDEAGVACDECQELGLIVSDNCLPL